MPKVKTLTQLEWEIMKRVWKNGKTTVREVHEALSAGQSKAYTTIQTYMERLVDKKYLSKEKIGLVNFYTARVKESDTLKRETTHFVKRAFDGSVSKLAAFLFDTQDFNEHDLEEIKRLIESREQKND
ncbi:MAG: BlaI/MecI/CopY family transcriptional regulator [Fidelibacterota bacterium]